MSHLRDFKRVYISFRENAGGVTVSGQRLTGSDGKRIGYIERISYTPDNIRIDGWADADRVALVCEADLEIAGTVPSVHRRDVQAILNLHRSTYGFSMNIPAQTNPVRLKVYHGGTYTSVKIPPVSLAARIKNEAKLSWNFGKIVLSALPDVISWVRFRDVRARRRVGALFRASGQSLLPLDAQAVDPNCWDASYTSPITIVLPVYQGLHLLNDVIGRVISHTDLPWHLVVIDDASPDPAVSRCLRDWQIKLTTERMTLVINPNNLGFVGTANVGLEIALQRGSHVVLLNSDALVPANWASRLLAPLLNESNIASVTPFSNDAEIANVPIPSRPMALMPGEGDVLDNKAREHAHSGSIVDVPTGVGFCMAMNIEVLKKIPSFDMAFGKGYGEEVDWCQKASALGWRNIMTGGLFVEHHGGQSFGPEIKQTLTRDNGRIISRRYPKFDENVQNFVKSDPLRRQRMMLGIHLAARRASSKGHKLSVFLGHGMGGGAETYLKQRIEQETEHNGFAVVIRAMPDTFWHIELYTQGGDLRGRVERIAAALPFFSSLTNLHVVYSCGVGADRPRDIPRALSVLSKQPGCTLEIVFNDYYPISPSYTLLDSRNTFSGFPLDSADPAHRYVEADGSVVELHEWRAVWGEIISKAGQLTTFSRSSASIVEAAWPAYRNRIKIIPHQLPFNVPALIAHSDEPVIGVLGNISRAKGADVLVRLSEVLADRQVGRLILIGNIEPGYRLTKPSIVLGGYKLNQLSGLVSRHGITRWFFPSIWPETFSYAVHEMIATGLPVWSFDIGAQSDAVKSAYQRGQGGGTLPLNKGEYDLIELADALTVNYNRRARNLTGGC